jgi:hypothetical protein
MKKKLIYFVLLLHPLFIYAQHASLLDVWNAGTRVFSQGLDMASQEIMRRNERLILELKNDIYFAASNFIGSLRTRSDYENFMTDWYKEKIILFNLVLISAQSDYVRQSLRTIYLQCDIQTTEMIRYIQYSKRILSFDESGGAPP